MEEHCSAKQALEPILSKVNAKDLTLDEGSATIRFAWSWSSARTSRNRDESKFCRWRTDRSPRVPPSAVLRGISHPEIIIPARCRLPRSPCAGGRREGGDPRGGIIHCEGRCVVRATRSTSLLPHPRSLTGSLEFFFFDIAFGPRL